MTGGGGGGEGRKTHVSLAEVVALAGMVRTPVDESLVLAADGGDPEAQCDLALWLLEIGRAAAAREWFTYAARAGYPDAMCWLGRDLLVGQGGTRDEAGGMLWLNQAASRNSRLGQALMAALYGATGQQARAAADLPALEQLLDAVEREVLLSTLHETADPS